MNYEKMTLSELMDELIVSTKKAYPFFIAGAFYWIAVLIVGQLFSEKITALIYIIAMGSIFPLAMLFGKLLNIEFMTSKNPLATLTGIVGGMQAFFIPIWIVTYMESYEYVPFMVGILAATHFLPFTWIYKSKAYLFLTISSVITSFVFGYIFIGQAFLFVPISQALIHITTCVWLISESKQYNK
ncbi:hypothetical protein SPD48_05180 [Pseudogracilibacillus sp. SE30717A]|uniref:DUF7010 family protein n=1 Tax=Pseudogracilibacillus sp. SE30717A TaxID=3098293 RepID=UPI00300DC6A8